MKNCFLHRLNSFFLALWLVLGAHAAELGGSVTLAATPADSGLADFVHDTCVFDTLLPAFRQLAAFYAPPEKGSEGHAHGTCFTDYVMEVPDLARRTYVWPGGWAQSSGTLLSPSARCRRDTLVAAFCRYAEGLHRRPDGWIEAEKARLVRQLEAFRDTAAVLPLVYVAIEGKYKGDVRAYVAALFKHSVVTNVRRTKRFAKSPTPTRMIDDMGVQLAAAKWLYRLWEQQGRPAQPQADGTRFVILRSELAQLDKAGGRT